MLGFSLEQLKPEELQLYIGLKEIELRFYPFGIKHDILKEEIRVLKDRLESLK